MKTEKIIASVMSVALSITTVFPIGLSEMSTYAVSVSDSLYAPVVYENDSYALGDINGDKLIDSNDATGILAEYSALSIGGKGTFNENQKKSADIDKNNIIDSADSALILSYYSYTSTGGKLDMQSFLDEQNHQQTETTTTTGKSTTTTTGRNTTTTTATGKATTTTGKNTTTTTATGKITTTTGKNTTTTTTVSTTSTATETTTTTATANPNRVSEIRLTQNKLAIKAGTGALSAYVTMLPSTALNKAEKWSSSDEEIAVVDNEGWVYGKKAGECDITVQSVDNPAVSAVIHVTVYEKEPPVTTTSQTTTESTPSTTTTTSNVKVANIILSKYEMTVPVGKKDISMVTMLPYEAINKEEIWVSSDESIATVDKYGWVKGVSVGECTVTVYSVSNPTIKAEIKVKIVDKNTEVPTPEYNFSYIVSDKSDSKNIAFCTPFPKNISGSFTIDYIITDSDGKVTKISRVIDSGVNSITTMLTANTSDFIMESYITNLSTNQCAKIGKYKLCLSPRDAVSIEEDINSAFSVIGGLS